MTMLPQTTGPAPPPSSSPTSCDDDAAVEVTASFSAHRKLNAQRSTSTAVTTVATITVMPGTPNNADSPGYHLTPNAVVEEDPAFSTIVRTTPHSKHRQRRQPQSHDSSTQFDWLGLVSCT